jgi:hypothetical protein
MHSYTQTHPPTHTSTPTHPPTHKITQAYLLKVAEAPPPVFIPWDGRDCVTPPEESIKDEAVMVRWTPACDVTKYVYLVV